HTVRCCVGGAGEGFGGFAGDSGESADGVRDRGGAAGDGGQREELVCESVAGGVAGEAGDRGAGDPAEGDERGGGDGDGGVAGICAVGAEGGHHAFVDRG